MSLVFCLSWSLRGGASTLVLDEDFSSELIGKYLEVYPDPSGTLEFEQVMQKDFTPNPHAIPALGYSKTTYWYRISLENSTPSNKTLYLELAVAWIDEFSVFIRTDDFNWMRYDAGARSSFQSRITKNNMPTHKIEIPRHSGRTIYIRASSSDTLVFPFHLRASDSFESYIRIKEQLYGVFAGIMAAAAFYGLIFFVYTFNRAYLYYLFTTISLLLMFLVWDGYGREFVFKDNYWWNKKFNVIFLNSTQILGALFCRKYIDLESYSTLLSKLHNIWVGLQCSLAFLTLVFPYPQMMMSTAIIGLFFGPLLIFSGFVAFRRGSKMAAYYLQSWAFPFVGVVFFSGMVVGLIPGSLFAQYSLHFGLLCQCLFLSFGLSYHLREATQKVSILKITMEAAGLAHSGLMKNELDPQFAEVAYRYLPCQESGGDLFSCILDSRGSYAYVVVGDISGHGITSSIISSAFTGALNAAIRGLKGLDLCLDESCTKIMDDLHLVMCDYFARTDHFASAVLVGIDLCKGHATYINAGHRNIFLKSGNKVKTILRGGSLMGFSTDYSFTPVSFQMAVGDILLFYTDGLIENSSGTSEKDSLKIIKDNLVRGTYPEQIIESIWLPLSQSLSTGGEDDMTILVLKMNSLMTTHDHEIVFKIK